jgi:hypothetical protein
MGGILPMSEKVGGKNIDPGGGGLIARALYWINNLS